MAVLSWQFQKEEVWKLLTRKTHSVKKPQKNPPNQPTETCNEKNPTYFPIRIFLFGPFPKKSSGAGLFLTGLIGLESGGLQEKKMLFSIKLIIFKEQNQAISDGTQLNHNGSIQKDWNSSSGSRWGWEETEGKVGIRKGIYQTPKLVHSQTERSIRVPIQKK